MLKSDIIIYVEFPYLHPNFNIYNHIVYIIQMVIYMSKMSIDIYPNAVSIVHFIDNFTRVFTYLQTVRCIYMSCSFSTYTYIVVSTTCKCS